MKCYESIFTEYNNNFTEFIWFYTYYKCIFAEKSNKIEKMKKILLHFSIIASAFAITCCTQEDPFESYWNNNSWTNNGNVPSGNSSGTSSTTGELATFDVAIDKTSSEPATTATDYYPDE